MSQKPSPRQNNFAGYLGGKMSSCGWEDNHQPGEAPFGEPRDRTFWPRNEVLASAKGVGCFLKTILYLPPRFDFENSSPILVVFLRRCCITDTDSVMPSQCHVIVSALGCSSGWLNRAIISRLFCAECCPILSELRCPPYETRARANRVSCGLRLFVHGVEIVAGDTPLPASQEIPCVQRTGHWISKARCLSSGPHSHDPSHSQRRELAGISIGGWDFSLPICCIRLRRWL